MRVHIEILMVAILCLVPASSRGQSDLPRDGYVPDEKTAVRIAEAVLSPIYGEKHVHSERPFRARLQGDHWIVKGTLPKPRTQDEIVLGGTMVAEINRTNGSIRAVYHLK